MSRATDQLPLRWMTLHLRLRVVGGPRAF
jgi:hypothetical protein